MPKISLQMFTMRDFTKTIGELDTTLGKLKEIGFDTLQYTIPESYDVKQVKAMFDSYGISNDSVYCPHNQIKQLFSKTVEQCELFGTKRVRIGSIPRELSSTPEGYRQFAHYLNENASEYKKHGMKLLYHFHVFEFIRFGNTYGIEILMNETDPEIVELNPDTHWIQAGGFNPTKFLEKHRDRYEYIHCKDFTVHGMGETWESYPIDFAPVGEGSLEWDSILNYCVKTNVKVCAIEQDWCYGRNAFDCVKQSYDFLSTKLNELRDDK